MNDGIIKLKVNLLRSPNSGLAVVTVVTCKQMLEFEDNHGYVRMSMQGLTGRRG